MKTNEQMRQLQLDEAMKSHVALRESIQKRQGFNPDSIEWEKAEFTPGFWKKLEEATGETLREANVGSSLGQLFRYGIQHFMFDAYKSVPVVYPDWVQVRPSSNRQEWYAPLYGAEIPEEVAPGGKFNDSRIQGLDVVLINKKAGRILGIQRELFDDDQTGQIVQRASKLGERMRYREEYDCVNALRGGTYSTTIGNKPASYVALTQAALENADIALMSIRDPLGNRMLVTPGVLVVSSKDKFNSAKLLNSTLQPSIPGASGETIGNAASQGTGWTMTVNPLQGLYQLSMSRFLGIGDWFLMEARTSFPFQERDPLEIVQENPQSGASFERDEYRWRVRRRYQTALVESRYVYAGYINATAPTI